MLNQFIENLHQQIHWEFTSIYWEFTVLSQLIHSRMQFLKLQVDLIITLPINVTENYLKFDNFTNFVELWPKLSSYQWDTVNEKWLEIVEIILISVDLEKDINIKTLFIFQPSSYQQWQWGRYQASTQGSGKWNEICLCIREWCHIVTSTAGEQIVKGCNNLKFLEIQQ